MRSAAVRNLLVACLLLTLVSLAEPAMSANAVATGVGRSAASLTGSPAAVASSTPRVVWDHCRAWVPKRARCGHLSVLADPLRPKLGRQRVGFELYPRSDRSRPALTPIVANEGGPGYPSTGSRSWYLGLFKPLMKRRALLLVDERGTGTSGALRCPALQQNTMRYVAAVRACGKQLGRRADTYSTAYAADDLASVLDALAIHAINLYGDSYGTFFSQVFALRHPGRLRTLVLDASYPVSGSDPWWRDTNRAIRDALSRVCTRDVNCAALGGSPVGRMRTLAKQLDRHPVAGHAYDSEGNRRSVRLNGVNLALLTGYATYGTSIYRELDPAVRAYRAGFRAPLMRMVAENVVGGGGNGPVVDYSAAEYAAVICSDYPQLWNVNTPPGSKRRAQYRHSLAQLRKNDPNAFDPFSIDDWVKSSWSEPRTCLGWPTPTDPLPPEEPGAVYPDVPTLVLSGDLDTVTSPEGGVDVASRFPDATFVSVPNMGHVVALADKQGCTSAIVLRFVTSGGDPGNTSCVSRRYPPVRVVPRFARTSKGLSPVTQGSKVRSSVVDRRVIAGAAFAAADVMTRWWANYSGSGVGLRGGTFTFKGGPPITFTLRNIAFVKDVSVTGKVVWNRNNAKIRVNVAVDGPGRHDGRLAMRWNDWKPDAQASVTGTIGGRPVALVTRAP